MIGIILLGSKTTFFKGSNGKNCSNCTACASCMDVVSIKKPSAMENPVIIKSEGGLIEKRVGAKTIVQNSINYIEFSRIAGEFFGRDYLLAWSGGEEVVSTPGYFEKEHVFQIVLPPLQFLQEAGKRAVRDPDKKMEGLVKKIKEVTKQ